jgi:hypothetical protein
MERRHLIMPHVEPGMAVGLFGASIRSGGW